MSVDLQITTNLSLLELQRLHRDGKPVSKTPHVGNWRLDTLACATLGIPHKVVDANKGALDHNFHPDSVIVGGHKTLVGHPDRLMSHAVVLNEPEVFQNRFRQGASLREIHMRALCDAVPQTVATPWSQHLSEIADDAIAIMEVITEVDTRVWSRRVYEDGYTVSDTCRGWVVVEAHGIFGVTNSKKGWISPNIVNIMLDMIVDAKQFGSSVVYHLSGPDMYKYLGKLMPDINKLYDLCRAKLGWNIPEVLTFKVIPVADMRFAVPESHRRALNRLIDVWLSVSEFEDSIGSRIKSSDNPKTEVARVIEDRATIEQRLEQAVKDCLLPFFKMERGNYTTQYDILASGESIYVHPWGLETQIADIQQAFRKMEALSRRA